VFSKVFLCLFRKHERLTPAPFFQACLVFHITEERHITVRFLVASVWLQKPGTTELSPRLEQASSFIAWYANKGSCSHVRAHARSDSCENVGQSCTLTNCTKVYKRRNVQLSNLSWSYRTCCVRLPM
jgi:hypothetical protein